MAWDFDKRSQADAEKRAMAWDFNKKSESDFEKRAIAWDFNKRLADGLEKRAMAWDFNKKDAPLFDEISEEAKRAIPWDFTKKFGKTQLVAKTNHSLGLFQETAGDAGEEGDGVGLQQEK